MKKVLAGGVFLVLHKGHEFFLKKARELGDFLVVVIASDITLTKKKGSVIKGAEERKKALEKTRIANKVVIGDDEDWFRIIEKENPDVIALGHDQELDDKLKRSIMKLNPKCRIIRIKEKYKNYNSSSLVENERGHQTPNS
jgi:FAD synthetase